MVTDKYEFSISIHDDDIDDLSHVNNASYIKWVQHAVVAHWKEFANGDLQSRYLWMALRHEIDYIREAFLKDNLIAEVTIQEIKKVRVTYNTVIKRGENIIASAVSTWCCISSETHRPKRIGNDILVAFGVSE